MGFINDIFCWPSTLWWLFFFFFQAEDGIRDLTVTGVQTCALPIYAGIFSTATDLARICRMLLDGGALDGRRILKPQTVHLMWTRSQEGRGTRALGWDMTSGYATIAAPFFPAGSVGHTGFTGTSVWIDPSSRAYVIILTNRVHPNGGSSAAIRDLRVRVA